MTCCADCQSFAARSLSCASSPVANKLRLYCGFKDKYYAAISCYYQGTNTMATEDAQHCAQAIADFRQAQTLLGATLSAKQQYDGVLGREKARRAQLLAVFQRSQQIMDRDLEILTHRNDSVYYERIPEPHSTCAPLGLVRSVAFPGVPTHVLWDEPGPLFVAPVPVTAATAAASGPRPSCCDACCIS